MIKPDNRTVLDILNSDLRYEIPAYQRDYRWGESEASELVDDLNESGDVGLFLGTIILNSAREKEKISIVVDGQQRLTTISILLIACREVAKKVKAAGLAEEIQRKLTVKDYTGKDIGFKVVTSESIREAYEYIARYDWDGQFPDKKKRQFNRIKPVYSYFYDKLLAEMGQDQLVAFLDKVFRAHVISLGIQDTAEAFSIFERTNARGVNLAASDLLKNTFFSKGIEGIADQWKEIVDNSNDNILRMLKYYYVSYNGLVTKSKLYPKIKDRIRDIGAEAVIEELQQFSEFYDVFVRRVELEIKNYFEAIGAVAIRASDPYLNRIFRSAEGLGLFKITQVYPIIYSALQCLLRNHLREDKKSAERFVLLLECLERYHFINNAIGDRIGNEVEKFYADYCKEFAASSDFGETSALFLRDLRNKLIARDQFISSFSELSYSVQTKPLVAYIFDRINAAELKPSEDHVHIYNSDPKLQRRFYNIEHFYPSSKRADLGSDDVVDSIGNLLVIGVELNSSLNNKDPIDKMKSLVEENRKRSAKLPYLMKFVEEYQPLAERWNHELIKKRARNLAEEAYDKVWAFRI